jgi:3'-5' exoribonuclease
MILSHHGSLEFGSPKVPMFLEAMLLHQIDTMDSKMEAMRAHVAKDRQATGVWTGYNSALERIVLKKERYLQEPEQQAAAAAAAAPLPTAAAPIAKVEPTSAFAAKLQGALKTES